MRRCGGHLLDARGAVLRQQARARASESRFAVAALDITTTLDPNLVIAYRFGAMFLSQTPPAGAGRPDQAVELIQRGIQANPDYWRCMRIWDSSTTSILKDYPKAADAFLEGSKKPNAQVWMKVMAAKIAAEGESF